MFRKVLHILLAVFVLVASSGFTINLHYCNDHLYDFSLNAPAHSCCEASENSHCHAVPEAGNSHQCKDETIVVPSTGEFISPAYFLEYGNEVVLDLLFTRQIPYSIHPLSDSPVFRLPPRDKPPPGKLVISELQAFLL